MDAERGLGSLLSRSIHKQGSFFAQLKQNKPMNADHLRAVLIVLGPEKVLELLSIGIYEYKSVHHKPNEVRASAEEPYEINNRDKSWFQKQITDLMASNKEKDLLIKKLTEELIETKQGAADRRQNDVSK